MKRITLVIVSTIAVLVLLFSYRTSLGESGTTSAQAIMPARVVSGTTAAAATTGQGPDPARTTDRSPQITHPSAQVTSGSDSGAANTTAPRPTSAKAGSATAAPTTAAPTTAAPTTAAPAAGLTATVDGASEMTRYGAVQVQVVITNGAITDVVALQYPQGEERDIEINQQAIPALHDEVVAAQSAHVDGVSGATYTTDGYLSSLQSALDAAGFQA